MRAGLDGADQQAHQVGPVGAIAIQEHDDITLWVGCRGRPGAGQPIATLTQREHLCASSGGCLLSAVDTAAVRNDDLAGHFAGNFLHHRRYGVALVQCRDDSANAGHAARGARGYRDQRSPQFSRGLGGASLSRLRRKSW